MQRIKGQDSKNVVIVIKIALLPYGNLQVGVRDNVEK